MNAKVFKYNSPIQTDENAMREMRPYQNLAKSVITQAYMDATSKCNKAYARKNRNEAISFLCGTSKGCMASLKSWCEVAGISADRIIMKSRELFLKKG